MSMLLNWSCTKTDQPMICEMPIKCKRRSIQNEDSRKMTHLLSLSHQISLMKRENADGCNSKMPSEAKRQEMHNLNGSKLNPFSIHRSMSNHAKKFKTAIWISSCSISRTPQTVSRPHCNFTFILRHGRKTVCVIQPEKQKILEGMIQNILGCEAVSKAGNLDVVYGIVTDSVSMARSSGKSVRCISVPVFLIGIL